MTGPTPTGKAAPGHDPTTAEPDARASGDSDLIVMTEADLAALRADEGARVVERNGRFWVETFKGFYQPIHQIARFPATQVERPTWRCWGYRAALAEADIPGANGTIPVHLMDDLANFSESVFDESRRRLLRRCRREVEIRRVRDPEAFLETGYAVYLSAKERVPYGGLLTELEYRAEMTSRTTDPRRVYVAGFVEGELAGYMESYAVDGVLYGRDLFVASEAMRTGIATGLYLETIQIGVRAGTVDVMCLGPVLLERPGLGWFKVGMGFPIVEVPAKVAILTPIRAVIKSRRPAVYYRITGERGDFVPSTAHPGALQDPPP